jgi:predicted metalloprotease
MEWTPGDMSSDVEDRRDDSGGGGGGGFGGGGLGIGGVLVLLVVGLITGHNYLGALFSGGGSQQPTQRMAAPSPRAPAAGEDRDAHLISYVLDDVQQQWTQIFAKQGKQYRHAKLVLFRGSTYSGCGTAQASTGPFYCPQDEKVYIDLDFWDELRRFGGSTADFAQAYVIAHELGHHVQKLLGTEGKVARLEQQEPAQRLHLSVDTELQADCYAGVWAHTYVARGKADASDINNALNAAAAVGDDHLQKMSGRAVSPETWTHGSAAQRTTWFKRGETSGDMGQCNTFGGSGQ